MRPGLRPLAALAAAAAIAACEPQGFAPAGSGAGPAEPAAGAAAAHHHAAPHGGLLVELEREALNVEILHDAATGAITLWVLDGCAEKPVRLVQEKVTLQVVAGGTAFRVDLEARESSLTGEKRGDSSEFSGRHDRLRGAGTFKAIVESLSAAGRSFQGVKFEYARPSK